MPACRAADPGRPSHPRRRNRESLDDRERAPGAYRGTAQFGGGGRSRPDLAGKSPPCKASEGHRQRCGILKPYQCHSSVALGPRRIAVYEQYPDPNRSRRDSPLSSRVWNGTRVRGNLGMVVLLAGARWPAPPPCSPSQLLRRWASRSLTEAVPEGSGAWEEVFTLLYRRQRDETARSRQLAHSLARSRQAGRALPYGVAILDDEYRIVWCIDSCEAHFGIGAEADVGHPITNLVRQPEFVKYVAAGEFAKPLQLKTTRDGLVLSVQFVPYVDSQLLLLSRDITQATRLETMRRDFVANVSPELRTPLTVLVGFLETVRELKLDPERSRDYLNLMAEQSRRMQRIIDDLLTLSTLESTPEPPHDEQVDVGSLLSRIHGE